MFPHFSVANCPKQIKIYELGICDGKLKSANVVHFFFIRNHFISNQVLDSLKFNKLLELQGKS